MTIEITTTTCNEACWRAKEESCSCSCGGKNHGCLKQEFDDNGEALPRPPRQMRKYDHVYTLHSIHATGGDAWRITQAYKAEHHTAQGVYRGRHWTLVGVAAFDARATESQMKWEELKGLVDPERKWKRPYLAWVRSDILEAEVANA